MNLKQALDSCKKSLAAESMTVYGIWMFLCGGVIFKLAEAIPATKCRDGWLSPSIGIQGACSQHGGVERHELLIFLTWMAIGTGSYFLLGVGKKRENKERRS